MLSLFLIWMWGVGYMPSIASDPIVYRELNINDSWDTESDDSFQKVLNKSHPFKDLYYVPNDLESVISDFTYNNSRKFQLRKEAAIAFADMAWYFWNDFNWKKRLSITTAYRSYKEQKYLNNGYCLNKPGQCADAWTSEHQAWLALDLWVNWKSIDKISLQWLQDNAYKWGFHNTYQKGIEVDGQMVEPWHRRYVGDELAEELYEKNLSLAERYNLEK